jgi:hypothetical protein
VHNAGSKVYNQSSTKTIPYKDRTLTQSIVADGIADEYLFSFDVASINDIEVFVAGKRLNKNQTIKFNPQLAQDSPEGDENFAAEFELGREITLNNNLITGSFEVGDVIFGTNNFVGEVLAIQTQADNTVLRYKTIEGQALSGIGIRKFDIEGDEIASAIVEDHPMPVSVIFEDVPSVDQKILIIKKIGKLWTEDGVRLSDAENDIAQFLKLGTGELPE